MCLVCLNVDFESDKSLSVLLNIKECLLIRQLGITSLLMFVRQLVRVETCGCAEGYARDGENALHSLLLTCT